MEGAAVKLRFRPNGLAKELRSGGKSNVVGLIVADIANPFFSSLAAAVETAVHTQGLELLLGATGEDPERERQLVRSFMERRAQALLIVPASEDHRYLQFEASIGTPIVFVDRPPSGLGVDVVTGDNFEAARRATRELVRAGHRRIGVLGDHQHAWTARQRLAGVKACLSEEGLVATSPLVREGAHTPELASQEMRSLLELPDPPSAVFALNNLSMLGALRTLRDSPTSLTLMGFDDSDAADLLGISVVATDPLGMGRRAAELALARINGAATTAVNEVIHTPLVVRTPLDQPVAALGR